MKYYNIKDDKNHACINRLFLSIYVLATSLGDAHAVGIQPPCNQGIHIPADDREVNKQLQKR